MKYLKIIETILKLRIKYKTQLKVFIELKANIKEGVTMVDT